MIYQPNNHNAYNQVSLSDETLKPRSLMPGIVYKSKIPRHPNKSWNRGGVSVEAYQYVEL